MCLGVVRASPEGEEAAAAAAAAAAPPPLTAVDDDDVVSTALSQVPEHTHIADAGGLSAITVVVVVVGDECPTLSRRSHSAACCTATVESEQQSEWRPRSAAEWIGQDIRPTDVRISMGPSADYEVACNTSRGYHCSHPCSLAALVQAQTEDYQLRTVGAYAHITGARAERRSHKHATYDHRCVSQAISDYKSDHTSPGE